MRTVQWYEFSQFSCKLSADLKLSFCNSSDSLQMSRTPYNSQQGNLLAMVALPAVASVR